MPGRRRCVAFRLLHLLRLLLHLLHLLHILLLLHLFHLLGMADIPGKKAPGIGVSARGTVALQPLRPTTSGVTVKGGDRYYGGRRWRRMMSVFQQE